MSTVLLVTTVASLLYPKKKQDVLRAQYEVREPLSLSNHEKYRHGRTG